MALELSKFGGSVSASIATQSCELKGHSKRTNTTPVPFWLKAQSFRITKSLKEKLMGLPDDDARELSYVQDVVIYLGRKERNPSLYVNVGAKYFNDGIGSNYREIINKLVAMNELEVNERYQEGSEHREGFTKSYRVPCAARNSGIDRADYRAKRTRLIQDKSKASGALIEHIKHCYSQLTVRETPSANTIEVVSPRVADGLRKILSGAANLTYGKTVERLFHTILEMESAGRVFIVHKEGKRLAEFDMKTCHPLLLAAFCQADEKATYLKFVQTCDIYSHVANQAGVKVGRDAVKTDFMRFYNGGIKNYVYRFYADRFPKLAAFIISKGKEMAVLLQNLEARIMVESVGAECAARGLFYIPMHDGWLGLAEDGRIIAALVVRACESIAGLTPIITSKDLYLCAVKETVSPLIPNVSLSNSIIQSSSKPSPSLSYVQVKNSRSILSCTPCVVLERKGRPPSGLDAYRGLTRLLERYASG